MTLLFGFAMKKDSRPHCHQPVNLLGCPCSSDGCPCARGGRTHPDTGRAEGDGSAGRLCSSFLFDDTKLSEAPDELIGVV